MTKEELKSLGLIDKQKNIGLMLNSAKYWEIRLISVYIIKKKGRRKNET